MTQPVLLTVREKLEQGLGFGGLVGKHLRMSEALALLDDFIASVPGGLGDANDTICNALAEKYPMNWDSTDIDRHKDSIRTLLKAAELLNNGMR